MNPLPNWALANPFPAIHDFESLTVLDQTARLYAAMQKLIEEYNNFAGIANEQYRSFSENETEARKTFENNINKVMREFLCSIKRDLQKAENENVGVVDYVTPEMFGAVGDGVTDDTIALENAFNSGHAILCNRNATYKCSRQIVCNGVGFNFNGNGCTLLNFSIKLNLNYSYQWVSAYPAPLYVFENATINNVHATFENSVFETGTPIRIQNIAFWFCKGLITIAESSTTYMDYIVMDNVTNYEYQGTRNCITSFRTDGTYNNYVGLGDMRYFREVHGGAGENFAFIRVDAMQPVTFDNCLNLKIEFGGLPCVCNVVNCHFEGEHAGFVYSEGLELPSNVLLNVRDSFFWDHCRRITGEGVTYEGCKFIVEFMGMDTDIDNNVPYIELNANNCSVSSGAGRGGLPGETIVKLSNYKDVADIGDRATAGSTLAFINLADADNCHGRLASGNYTYYAYLTIYRDICIGGQGNPNAVEVAVDGNQIPRFVMITNDGDVNYRSYFAHIFRVDSGGGVKRVILPPDNERYMLLDYGQSLNGIKWETVDALPENNITATKSGGTVYIPVWWKDVAVGLLPGNTFYYCDGTLSYKE